MAAFADLEGSIVIINCASGNAIRFNPQKASEKLPPCSTFKIWNTLIGFETGAISSPAEAFYRWDGETRSISSWNKDMTLKEAFAASCVPAFQALARKIGPEKMKAWIEKIGYGDRDISAGIDVFWLPAPGRKTILISAEQQAQLMRRLVSGEFAFSDKSCTALKEIMAAKRTDHGILYGKTGTGVCDAGERNVGWYVGYVESHGEKYAFACVVKGRHLMGKDARAIVEAVFEAQELL